MADDNNAPSNKELMNFMQKIYKRLDSIDSIGDRLSSIEKRLEKIDLLEQRVSGTEKELNKMCVSLDDRAKRTHERVDWLEDRAKRTHERVDWLEDRAKRTNERVDWLEDRVKLSDMSVGLLTARDTELERQLEEVRHNVTSQTMRNNLIFTNTPVDSSSGNKAVEETERKLRQHLISALNLAAESAESIRFERVHSTEGQPSNDGHLFLALLVSCHHAHSFLLNDEYDVWVTTGDQSRKLYRNGAITTSGSSSGYSVWVDRTKRRQTIEGFGGTLTSSSAYVIYHSCKRNDIMNDLFGPNGIGISYVRLPMGSTDLQAVNPYTYDDSWNDMGLGHFSIDKDKAFIIPILKQALSINPLLKVMATPWSAPAWMKNGNQLFGGDFRGGQYMDVLANYFVKFIQAYAREGITIHSVTVQNEPLLSRNDYPTMKMSADQQKEFVRDHLGPKFHSNGIQTKILIFDHNWQDSWYPEQILQDSNAARYVSGVAWHGYGGRHDTPGAFHNKFPNVGMYFTEVSGGAWDTNFASTLTWDTRIVFIGQTRNWAKVAMLFNLALDQNHGPKVGVHGCQDCRGIITVNNDCSYTKNVEYYSLAHFSKFVKPDAVRLESNDLGWDVLQTAAFVNPDGSTVVIVQNPSGSKSASFSLDIDAKHYHYSDLPPNSVATFYKQH